MKEKNIPNGQNDLVQDNTSLSATSADKSLNAFKNVAGGICHRVKNDFQTIGNILALASTKDLSSLELVYAVESRIGALSVPYTLVSNKGSLPNLESLVKEILARIRWRASENLECGISVPNLNLTLRLCSPLSLWLNEVMTNAVLHGLSDNPQPKLKVEATFDDDWFKISIQDNGPGFPFQYDPLSKQTLGMHVIQAISENDLRGKLRFDSKSTGLSVDLIVPKKEFQALNQGGWL